MSEGFQRTETVTDSYSEEYRSAAAAGQGYAEESVSETHVEYEDEPRQIDLILAKIDPWSVLKTGFLISIALGFATVVSIIAVWFFLDGMNVFGAVEDFLTELGAERFMVLLEYVRLPRVISYATILGVVNVVIFTALATLSALLYNLIAMLVGGIQVSLMDE